MRRTVPLQPLSFDHLHLSGSQVSHYNGQIISIIILAISPLQTIQRHRPPPAGDIAAAVGKPEALHYSGQIISIIILAFSPLQTIQLHTPPPAGDIAAAVRKPSITLQWANYFYYYIGYRPPPYNPAAMTTPSRGR